MEQRANIIKAELARHGIKQIQVARELGVSKNAIQYWVVGNMTSVNIENWFKDKFGEEFINKLKNAA